MTTHQTLQAVFNGPGEGDHFDFLNHLATVKVAAGDDRSMSVVEFLAPHGFGPPQHRHDDEDELFIILDGQIRLMMGDESYTAGAGSCSFLPRAVPHTFQVVSEQARILNVTASMSGPPRFDQMVAALGSPTERLTIPEPGYIDAARVAEVCHEHGIEVVGPPPEPIA